MTTRAFQLSCRSSQPSPRRPTVQHGSPVGLGSGKKLNGGEVTRAEARQLQGIQYLEDKKKFDEKEKEKLDKKRAEKWKRYSHVDLGETLSDISPLHDELELIRQQQQLLYETTAAEGLKLEQERREAQLKREEKKREVKLKKYAQVATGQRLGDEQNRGFIGFRNHQSQHDTDDMNFTSANLNQRTREINAVRGTKRSTSKATGNHQETSEIPTGSSHINNLNVTEELNETVDENAKSEVEKEEEYHRQMREARERMQRLYDEKKNNLI